MGCYNKHNGGINASQTRRGRVKQSKSKADTAEWLTHDQRLNLASWFFRGYVQPGKAKASQPTAGDKGKQIQARPVGRLLEGS